MGIGASAGGLDAIRLLVPDLPVSSDMAFILVQHLDPTHESLMVDLLRGHTALAVQQAVDGEPVCGGHLYVIPPGAYLAVAGGCLRLSKPPVRHGERMQFDFLLQSLARDYGARAICVVLSGTGADGSMGLRAIKQHGGLVIVQDPAEAGYDGMPRSAIATGNADLVLTVAAMPAALLQRGDAPNPASHRPQHAGLADIVALLRARTTHDFTLYKSGTLQRRIDRRISLAALPRGDLGGYLARLKVDPTELDLLAGDFLINVTSFFRDPAVFALVAEIVAPELVRSASPDHPLRIWIAGCSTGEETYSLAMLFNEGIAAAGRNVKLQVFASDVDPEVIAIAREGIYPDSIEADVSKERLARFFTHEDAGYRVLPELRACVVFTVQDVLADPPFARIDLVSCRNLMIYLLPEAQARALSLFHFALREGGVLLLGAAESVGADDRRFGVISKAARIYRHTTRSRPGEVDFSMIGPNGARLPPRLEHAPVRSRQASLAELCRRLVIENYAPAAVLINNKLECLYSLGPTERFLRIAPGHSTHELLAMVRPSAGIKLRAAIRKASEDNAGLTIRFSAVGGDAPYSISVQPVQNDGERLMLICFFDESAAGGSARGQARTRPSAAAAELERELEATRSELHDAIRSLELSSQEQKAINEEALSAAEEFQSTNEELLTSKEELQSLNEELTALNGQLQETLERQRTTSNDLQNILNSTNVATLFLDLNLNIRFFTPRTRLLFSVIPTDIGRPLADLCARSTDEMLLADAQHIVEHDGFIERDIQAAGDTWYTRRMLPYRTHDDRIEGVVITFTDITERRRAACALEAAKLHAERANAAKSRFLAAASHDLRQPLQSLALIQGLLAAKVEGETVKRLVDMLDPTLTAMSSMLNALLDINQIDAGEMHGTPRAVQIDDLLARLGDEFSYHAQAQGLQLRVVRCTQTIWTDPRLLEQMLRNLVSNALKYTRAGKVLLGCRRKGEALNIEVWDTGIGIPEAQLEAIFEEYHQIDNPVRERSRGLGLGLPIVRRLGILLGHTVSVRSWPGKGSCFTVAVSCSPAAAAAGSADARSAEAKFAEAKPGNAAQPLTATVLVIEDDAELSALFKQLLTAAGHRVVVAASGKQAIHLVSRGATRPDIILADYSLPGASNGLQVAMQLRERLHRPVPAIILSGDMAPAVLHSVAEQGCLLLNKPVTPSVLATHIQLLLEAAPPETAAVPHAAEPQAAAGSPVIFVVDDDSQVRGDLQQVLQEAGRAVRTYASCEDFLAAYPPQCVGCLLVDAYLPGMQGLELLEQLDEVAPGLPAIMITGDSDVPTAVRAMKAGALDFIEKPVRAAELLASVARALDHAGDESKRRVWHQTAFDHLAGLTPRQRQIMDLVLAGQPSKNIAADLGISQRTVENHRASIMKRTGSRSLPALARLAVAAAARDDA